MDGNKRLNEMVKQQQQMFIQRICDKHEYVLVTQTTTNNAPIPLNTSHSWLQCKHCSHTLPIPSQLLK